MKKLCVKLAIVALAIIAVVSMCGCLGGSLKDSSAVKERLERRGYTVYELNPDDSNWELSFFFSIYGLTDTSKVESAICGLNTQTYLSEANGGATVCLTEIYVAYCTDAESAQEVLQNAKEKTQYELYGTEGNIAYWGDSYAYKVATSDKMLYKDNAGSHFD